MLWHMMRIWVGDDWDALYSSKVYFKHSFEPEWLDSDFVKDMVQDVDKCRVVSPYCIESPVFGQIAPERLSGGVKGLILLFYDSDFYPDMSVFGNNCVKWLARRSFMRDIRLSDASICLDFDFCGEPMDGVIENTGEHFSNGREWLQIVNHVKKTERGTREYAYYNGRKLE